MRLLWLESRLVRLRGQVYFFWHVLPVLEVKERWRDKPWWCEHFSGVSGKLSCRSMLQPFISPLKHFHVIVTAEGFLFKDSCWVQWALKRGHNEQLLWSEEDGAFPRCSFAIRSDSLPRWGQGQARWASPSQLASSPELFHGIHPLTSLSRSAGLESLICVCPWCCRQIRSTIPAELLLLALASSMGRIHEIPAAWPCLGSASS